MKICLSHFVLASAVALIAMQDSNAATDVPNAPGPHGHEAMGKNSSHANQNPMHLVVTLHEKASKASRARASKPSKPSKASRAGFHPFAASHERASKASKASKGGFFKKKTH